jgi:hypothetical protein
MSHGRRPIIRLNPSATLSATSFICRACKGEGASLPTRDENAISDSLKGELAISDKSECHSVEPGSAARARVDLLD